MSNPFVKVFLCLLLVFSFAFVACDSSKGDDEETTEKKTTKKITEVTTAEISGEVPTDLIVEVLEENQILSRLTTPVTVEIDDKVNIELNYQGWPSICSGEGDVLYAVSSLRIAHIDPFGCTAFFKSMDGGKTWTEPEIIRDSPLDDRDAGVLYLGDGRILVSWFSHSATPYLANEDVSWTKWQGRVTAEQKSALLNKWNNLPAADKIGGSYVMLSEDGGETWGDPIQVPVSSPHGPNVINDGHTLLYFGKPFYASQCGFKNFTDDKVYVIQSRDFGRTWTYRAEVPQPDVEGGYYHEAHIIQLADGSYLAGIRSQEGVDQQEMGIYVTRSKDGYTWTPLEKVPGLVGGPPHFLQMPNGVVIVTYSYRTAPTGIRGMMSYDGGVTWSEEFVLCVSDSPRVGDLGYPSTAMLSDGTLITAYYQRYGSDTYDSFLYTKWRLVSATEIESAE